MSQPQPHAPQRATSSSRKWWAWFIVGTVVAAVAAFAVGGWIGTHRHNSKPIADPAACKAALAANYRKAMADGGKGPTQSEPAACVGLDQKTLERLLDQVVSEYVGSGQAKRDFGRLVASPTP